MPKVFHDLCNRCNKEYDGWNSKFCPSCCKDETQDVNTKWCSACGKYKSFESFGKWKYGRDGYRNNCFECRQINGKVYYKRKRVLGNWYFAYSCISKRFRHKDEITRDDFKNWYENTPKVCSYCGILEETWEKIVYRRHWGTRSAKRLSIDRIDNNKGYVLENICFACQPCNATKGSIFTASEMKEIGEKYMKQKWQKEIKIGETTDGF